jgi:putative phage-type endonuclease
MTPHPGDYGAPSILPSPRDRWLRTRRELVTASDCAAIIGEDPRRGPLAVYVDKVGDVEPEETVPMRRGRRLEAAIADEYADQTGRPVGALGEYEITRHPEIPWLGATLDRTTDGSLADPDPFGGTVAESRDGRVIGRAPLQIKMAIGSAREWKDEPPLGYVVQVQVEMACYSATWGALAALVGPGPLATVDLVRDDAFFATLVPQLERFRWHVQNRVPPEADGKPGTSAAIRRLWAGEDGETVPLDEEALRLAAEWEAAGAQEAAAKDIAAGIENRLRARLGSASFGALPDGRFLSLRLTERKGYTVGPTKYRVLRVMRPRLRRRG